jgi:hypothetical protein
MNISWSDVDSLVDLLEESDKAITGAVARDPIAWAQTNIFFTLGMRNPEIAKKGWDIYNSTMANFREDMIRLISDYRAGILDMESAIAKWKAFAGDHYKNLFQAGAAAVGNPYYAQMELTSKDLAFISSARRAESSYLKSFLVKMDEPGYEDSKSALMHPPLQRAQYYTETGKSQFFNGMINGAGENVKIHWVLGPVEKHCNDCPDLASKTWTWQTIPTVPRAGDTECLFNCACNLEFEMLSPTAISVPGSGTQGALTALGRWARVFSVSTGEEMTGQVLADAETLFQQMYKARQMIDVSKIEGNKEAVRTWIDIRRDINQKIIDKMADGRYRLLPTVSVSDLTLKITTVMEKYPGVIVDDISMLPKGIEIAWIRGNAWFTGITNIRGTSLLLQIAKGNEILINSETDIVIRLNKQ